MIRIGRVGEAVFPVHVTQVAVDSAAPVAGGLQPAAEGDSLVLHERAATQAAVRESSLLQTSDGDRDPLPGARHALQVQVLRR